jgi:hypothetical protein
MKTHPAATPPRGGDAGVGRRAFLTAAGLAGAGSVAALAVAPAEATESPEEMVAGRYRETPHVERFYFLNRL